MLKVIFKVEKLVLRCKNIQCQIVAKKDFHTIKLSPLLALVKGQAQFQQETEFLIIQNDPTFLIQVCLVAETYRKLGGEVLVNLGEWDEGVHHSTVAALRTTPDPNSLIYYTFLYIRKSIASPQKTLILCSEHQNTNLASIEIEKNELTKIHKTLEAQVKTLKSKKESLKNKEKIRNQEIIHKKKDHEQKIRSYQQKIDENRIKNDTLRKRNKEMVRMIQMYGKEETKNELEERYPEIANIALKEGQNFKRKRSELSQENDKVNEKTQYGKQLRKRDSDRQRSREKQKFDQK